MSPQNFTGGCESGNYRPIYRICAGNGILGFIGRDQEFIAMTKQAEFAIILKMNPMFAELGADELQRISNLCQTQQLASGEMLFQKGDSGDALFGIRRGQIRIELPSRPAQDFFASGGDALGSAVRPV